MNSKKDAHKLQKGKLKSLAGGLKGKDSGRSANGPRFCCVSLVTRESTTVQALRSEHAGQRSQNSPTSSEARAKWRVGISTRVSINLGQRACIENRVLAQAYRSRK